MMEVKNRAVRPWEQIARELQSEKDAARVIELARELISALGDTARMPLGFERTAEAGHSKTSDVA
jgi:hypothetical protein